MKLSAFKKYVTILEHVTFKLWNGEKVPAHYHITEIWLISKKFIDCGGEIRDEEKVSFQLRTADDTDHRLVWDRILSIIMLFEEKITSKNADADIEIEYQWNTIWKYWLERVDNTFVLTPTMTDCLAKDACGISPKQENSCCGGGGCC